MADHGSRVDGMKLDTRTLRSRSPPVSRPRSSSGQKPSLVVNFVNLVITFTWMILKIPDPSKCEAVRLRSLLVLIPWNKKIVDI